MARMRLVALAVMVIAGTVRGGTWGEALFEENHKDFGSVGRGPELTHRFKVKNTTKGPVSISGARVSCNVCSSVSVEKYQLQPGEETAVVVKMFTSRFIGIKVIHVYINFSQPQFDEVRLWVQANARDDVNITPDSLAFGTIRRGASPSQSANIVFYGTAASQITGLETETNYVQAKAERVEDAKKGAEVIYKVTATLRADTPVGKWFTDVWARTNNPAVPRVRIPLTVEIQPALSVTPSALSLGEVKMGESAEKSVVIRGTQPFKITDIKGAEDGLEILGNDNTAKATHVLKVRLKGTKEGTFNRTIKVSTDAGEDGDVEFVTRGQVIVK